MWRTSFSVQVLAGALCQYGGTDVKCSWQVPNTGGRLAVAAFRKGATGVERRDLLPPTQPDMAVIGYQQGALPVIEPDLSVRFHGPVAGEPRSIRVLLEVDRTDRPSYNQDKLVAYDHLLAGWYAHLDRKFGKPPVRPLVLFVSHTEEAARTIARHADATLNVVSGCRARTPPHTCTSPVATWRLRASRGCSRVCPTRSVCERFRATCAARTCRTRSNSWSCCRACGGRAATSAPRAPRTPKPPATARGAVPGGRSAGALPPSLTSAHSGRPQATSGRAARRRRARACMHTRRDARRRAPRSRATPALSATSTHDPLGTRRRWPGEDARDHSEGAPTVGALSGAQF